MRRVVVTGMGTVNPIGLNVDEYWEGLKAGKTGFGEITYFDTTDFKVKVAAEVKGFVAADRMDKKAARRMEPFAQYAVAAAKEAFEDAGLDMEKEDPYRVGCAIGSGVGSLQSIEREHKKLLEKGPSRINPLLVPLMITNMATGNVTIQLGIKGKSINVVTACATGTHSIGEAFRSIQYGEADVMLAGGTENAITPIGVGGFTALTALSTSNNPERCSIPFDKDRDGFVIGDGAGVVVLEGCAIGSGVGSLQSIEREHKKLLEKGPSRINPLLVPLMITNMATGNVTIQLGIKGKSINVVTACATGTHSIGEAFRSIQYGEADVMLAGGTENAITPIGVGGFTALTALSTSNNPERCSIPFDKDRDGFVIGDGAGVVVLEELEHAKARGAKILAEVVGYGATSDAYHITSPAEDGEGAKNAMLFALKDANVAPEEITYINAHGTSTHHNDLFETRAIKAAFGEHAYDIKVNSTKSMIGHLLGAAGAVEFIACVLQMNHGYVHQTVGLEQPDEELDLDYVQGHGVDMDFEYALTNSLAFGGHNASLLIKKYTE